MFFLGQDFDVSRHRHQKLVETETSVSVQIVLVYDCLHIVSNDIGMQLFPAGFYPPNPKSKSGAGFPSPTFGLTSFPLSFSFPLLPPSPSAPFLPPLSPYSLSLCFIPLSPLVDCLVKIGVSFDLQ